MAFCMGVQGCLDELRARPDLMATIQRATTQGSIREKEMTIAQICEAMKNPFYNGEPIEEDTSTPFVPMGELWED